MRLDYWGHWKVIICPVCSKRTYLYNHGAIACDYWFRGKCCSVCGTQIDLYHISDKNCWIKEDEWTAFDYAKIISLSNKNDKARVPIDLVRILKEKKIDDGICIKIMKELKDVLMESAVVFFFRSDISRSLLGIIMCAGIEKDEAKDVVNKFNQIKMENV